MNTPTRTFTDTQAERGELPLLIGGVGPSGGGKTMSALRLATGIQRVSGGDIYMLDTESRRGLHYADRFKFRHVEFKAPFSPLDYLAAVEYCVKKGAKVVIGDSWSHEHEGPGGVLEWHEAEVQRLSRGDANKAEAVKMLAWSQPKAARRRLINTVTQLGVHLICNFRAKQKLKIVRGKPPVPLGWMPIAGEEFIYEMTVNYLLPPGANGVPEWNPQEPGEREMVKLPEQFRSLFTTRSALSEDIGEAMAKWAAGGSRPKADTSDAYVTLAARVTEADDDAALVALWPSIVDAKKASRIRPDEFETLKDAVARRRRDLAAMGSDADDAAPVDETYAGAEA